MFFFTGEWVAALFHGRMGFKYFHARYLALLQIFFFTGEGARDFFTGEWVVAIVSQDNRLERIHTRMGLPHVPQRSVKHAPRSTRTSAPKPYINDEPHPFVSQEPQKV